MVVEMRPRPGGQVIRLAGGTQQPESGRSRVSQKGHDGVPAFFLLTANNPATTGVPKSPSGAISYEVQ